MRRTRGRVAVAAGVLTLIGSVGAVGVQWSRSYADDAAVQVAASESETSTVIFDCYEQPVFEPVDLTLTCSTFNDAVWDMSWSGWGRDTATGSGSFVLNECLPSCRRGRWNTYPVRAELTGRETRQGVSQYTVLTLRFTGETPALAEPSGTLRFDLPQEG